MAQNVKKSKELVVQQERTHFRFLITKNPNYFGNIVGSDLKANFKLSTDITFEQLTCVGYNPDTTNMEATFSIKRSTGYSGNLCTHGSFEYVRFYLDFHDGAGYIDQGVVAVNVHDIPASKDCKGKSIFPIQYVATLKKESFKYSHCDHPVLPTLMAILSWEYEPPAHAPNWKPVWGSMMHCDVQLRPYPKIIIHPDIDLSKYIQLATHAPHLSAQQLQEISGINIEKLIHEEGTVALPELAKQYEKLKVSASRYAYKTISNMIKFPTSEITMQNKILLEKLNVNINSIIDYILHPIDTSKANVDYEELECVGLDYNTESLVATIKIKKKAGYSGDLCKPGSKEYIAFWMDWDNNCSWQYINTVELIAHDINMPGDHLCYSVALPLNTKYHKKLCTSPNVIRVRGVLSWNVAPSITDPNKLEYYGNRVDAHIQIKPGPVLQAGDVIPLFNIIGGIDVDHVNDGTGLTKPGSFFVFNGLSVPANAPFGGVIVLNGPSFPGYRYKIKTINLNDGTIKYITDTFTVVGYLPHAPWVQYTTQVVDAAGYYHFLNDDQNTLNILARFTPDTDDKFRVDIEVDTVFGVFSKTIQIDNKYPDITLQVDDGGDCTHYTKGDTITGHFSVNDLHIDHWVLGSTWGGNNSGVTSGYSNQPLTPFNIPTGNNAYPCGSVSLWAIDKTIINSQSVGHPVNPSYNICLKEKKK